MLTCAGLDRRMPTKYSTQNESVVCDTVVRIPYRRKVGTTDLIDDYPFHMEWSFVPSRHRQVADAQRLGGFLLAGVLGRNFPSKIDSSLCWLGIRGAVTIAHIN